MRSFIFTLLLFGIMLGAIITNTVAIHRLTGDMLTLLDALPESAGEGENAALTALDSRWTDARGWVSLSVSSNDINRINSNLAALRAFCTDGDDADYFSARDQLLQAIEDMRRFETLAPENLI